MSEDRYTREEMSRLREVAMGEWKALAPFREKARDTIIDVRAYDAANNRYEAYWRGWEAQEDAKNAAVPILGRSGGPIIIDEAHNEDRGPLTRRFI